MAKRAGMRFPLSMPDLLRKQVAGGGVGERLREVEIWRFWPEVAGPVVARRAQPLRIINGTLTIVVSNAAWMQELRFLTSMMKEKLNERLGSELIREIVLRPGVLEKDVRSAVEDEPDQPIELTERQKIFIAEQAAGISDPEIREAFAALMKASLGKKISRDASSG